MQSLRFFFQFSCVHDSFVTDRLAHYSRYPWLQNTLWGGIWTAKTYLKHLLRRYDWKTSDSYWFLSKAVKLAKDLVTDANVTMVIQYRTRFSPTYPSFKGHEELPCFSNPLVDRVWCFFSFHVHATLCMYVSCLLVQISDVPYNVVVKKQCFRWCVL